MKRGQSSNIRFNKKQSFKPIMLTSKSMRPVERGSLDKHIQQQKKFNIKIDNEQFKRKTTQHCMIYANTMAKSQFIKKMTQQYRQSLLKSVSEYKADQQSGRHQKLTASIIKMQFQTQQDQHKTKSRYDPMNSYFPNQQKKGSKKFYYYTQKRESESGRQKQKFLKPCTASSFSTQMKNSSRQKGQVNKISKNQEWQIFLKKNNLTVKKAKSTSKRPEILISQDKLDQISIRVSQYQNGLLKKLQQSYGTQVKSPQKNDKSRNRSISLRKNILQNKTDLMKIQQDIQTKRVSTKKQYFTFAMGQTSKSSESNQKNKFQIYKDFLWKILFSNHLYIRLKDEIETPYKVYIGSGNNSMLIKGILRRRFWWQIVDKISRQTNFVWTQLKVNQFFQYQKKHIFNQKKTISLLRTRKVYSSMQSTENKATKEQINNQSDQLMNEDQIKEKQQGFFPKKAAIIEQFESVTDANLKIFYGIDYQLWSKHYQINRKYQDKMQNFMNRRIKTLIRRKNIRYIQDSSQLKIQNHFECNYYLGNKKALFYSLRKYYTLLDKNPFDFIPLTFHIVDGLNDPQFDNFLQYYEKFNEQKRMKIMQNIWIVKPGQHTNRGKGITVCSILDQIKIRLKSKEKSNKNKPRTFIVQKYIERPLLYYRRKFDIRHFMLMTCVNGCFKGYWYADGYLRTTSYQYNIKNCKDLYTHLTNDAIQKCSADYGKFEKGNKVSYPDFQKYLKNTYYKNSQGRNRQQLQKKYDFMNRILPKMKQLATDCMKATYMLLGPRKQENNFQLFGLDYMLDQDMNLYLIQVNTNPCLQTTCPLLNKIIPNLIQNVYKICVDPYFPPPFEWPIQKKMQMGENSLDQNKFSIIFDENSTAEYIQKMCNNMAKVDEKMGEIDQEQQQFEDQGKQWDQD